MSSLGVPSAGGFINIPLLNVNFLYIQGVPYVDFSGSIVYLQGEIDHIDNEVTALQSVVNRIDLTGLTGNLVITDANKNSVLLTAIQALQGNIGQINKLDLTGLPNAPPASCVITVATTNQALKALIDTNTGNITTLNNRVTDLSNQVIALQNQVTSINNSITALNAKTAHISVYTVAGGTVMTGIRDNTGFAVDLSADDSSNGLFVYPNGDGHNAQVRIETAQDKQLYMRGGSAVTLYAGANGSNTSRNAIFIGDQSDNIKIGSFSGAVTFPLVEIGCSGVGFADSTTRLKGDVYLTKGTEVSPLYTQVVTADGDAGFVGRLDTQSRLSLSGLAVTTTVTNPIIPITNLFGAITLTTGAGLISLIAGVGGINITAGGGAVAISTGGGAMSINCGAGVLNMASGTGNSNWTTANGDLYLGAGKGSGGSAGNITMQSIGNIVIQPDASLNIYHTDFIEMNTYGTAPATTTRRIYDISGDLYYNGVQISNDPSGNFVLISGSTMTGGLKTPQLTTNLIDSSGNLLIDPSGGTAGYNKTSYIEMVNGASTPATTTRRIYDICGNLYYNGTILSNTPDPSGIYVLKTGDVMTGNLVVPQVITTQIASFVTDLSLNSSLNLIVTPVLEGRYNRTGYIEFVDNSGSPAVTANRLYQQANQLFFDGTAIGGGGGNFLPLTGGTLTGALISNYDAGQVTPQLQLINTNNTGSIQTQGASLSLRNDATGVGAVLERCGQIVFQAKDSVGAGGRNYSSIQSFINDPTSTSIDGRLSTFVANNNNSTEIMRLQSVASGSVRRCDIGTTYMEVGVSAIGSTSTSTLTVNGTANMVTSLQTPLINNAVNIYPATSTTLVDNAVRQYQPERLYKLTTYPEPLGPPTRDGEKVYFVNPTGNPVNNIDGFFPYTLFQSITGFTGNFTWEYIQKACFLKGSSGGGNGTDAYYYSCKFNDGNSYIFAYIDVAGTTWKLYGVAKIYGEVNDMVVGNPATNSGGNNHRIYFGGTFATGDTASGTNGVVLNNVGGVTVQVISTGGIGSITFNQMTSAKDPAVAHEPNFTGIIGVSGTVNCMTNASGLNSTWGIGENADMIVIGGLFYNIGATGGVVNYRNMASIAWYNVTYTSGLQTDQIGWSTLDNNANNTSTVCGVGNSSAGKNVWGVGFFGSGWGVIVYEGQDFNNQDATVVASNYMTWFYKGSGSVAFQLPYSDNAFIEVGQTFPKENNYNRTNVIKGGNPTSGSAQYGDFVFNTLAVTNGLLGAGGSNWGIEYRLNPIDPYLPTLCLVIDDLAVNTARQPLAQNSANQVVGWYANEPVYGDQYFMNFYINSVYSSFILPQPYQSPNYQGLSVNGTALAMRSFASYSTILGYTGLNMYGMAMGTDANNCVYIYKTTNAGDLTVELSGCLVRTAPNIYATDTITFLGVNDGSSLMLMGDISTAGNPQGKPSWWAISQDGSIKYDNVTVDRNGVSEITGGTGILVSGTATNPVITNSGVTQIIAGTNVTITDTGGSGNGVVTINASAGGGDTTGYLMYYLQSTSNGGIVSLANQTNNIQSNTPLPAFYFLPNNPRTATGIATQFDLYNDGSLPASTGWIRWTGAQSVTFQMVVPISVSTYVGGVRISLPNTATYAYSNFGLISSVFNSTSGLENTDNPQRIVYAGASQITNLNNGASEPFDYEGELVINGVLKTNDYIKISFCANGVFNQAGQQPANVYTAICLGQLQTLTVQYTSYP
jgi:hypothetical protein